MNESHIVQVYKYFYTVTYDRLGLDYDAFNLMSFDELADYVSKLKSFTYVSKEEFPLKLDDLYSHFKYYGDTVMLRVHDFCMDVVGELSEKRVYSRKYRDVLFAEDLELTEPSKPF